MEDNLSKSFPFGSHRPPLQRRASYLTYFFFGFLALDFLAELRDDFFALLLESDFDLAFPDFDAEDFLAPLPFFAFSGGAPPPLGADAGLLTGGGVSMAGKLLTCRGTLTLATV